MKIHQVVASVAALWGSWQVGITAVLAAESGGSAGGHGASGANPLTWDPDLAIFTAIVFVLLLVVLGKFAWKPLITGLDQREQSIKDMIDEAQRGRQEAAQALAAYEQKMREAAAEAQGVVAEARRGATEAGERLLTAAREQADRERQRAIADIETAKNAAVKEIAQQSTELAFTLARKMIHRDLSPEDHAALVRESLDQFPSEN